MTKDNPQPRQSLSDDQRDLLLRLVKKMLAMGRHASEIKQAIAQEFYLSRRSVERYMKRARQEMIEHMDMPVKQHRSEALYFYHNMMNNPKSGPRERLRARERIDKLMGLDLPASIHDETLDFTLTPADIQAMSDEELDATYDKLMNHK
jgi:hypothetical protein